MKIGKNGLTPSGKLRIDADEVKGYRITHVATDLLVLWTRLKRDALAAVKELDDLDFDDKPAVEPIVARLREANLP